MSNDHFNIREQMLRRLSDALDIPMDINKADQKEASDSEEESEEDE